MDVVTSNKHGFPHVLNTQGFGYIYAFPFSNGLILSTLCSF